MIFKTGKIKLSELFESVSNLKGEDKIIRISEFFLNTPYTKGSISKIAEEEQKLTVDLEGVDCMTFLEYLEALRLSKDQETFIDNLRGIRYFNGIVSFQNRRHFFSDWDTIPTLENVTKEIGEQCCRTILKELNRINGKENLIEGLPIKVKRIVYIPTNEISRILDKITSVYYCGFFTSKQGLDVKHVGLLMRDKKDITLRHASSTKGKVVDESFTKYALKKEGIILFKPIFPHEKNKRN